MLELEVTMERQVRAQYTADYKAQAVSWAETLGAAKATRTLDISVKTLANWIRSSCDGAGLVKDGKRRPVSDLDAEVSWLRAENARSLQKFGVIALRRRPSGNATARFARQDWRTR